MEGKIYLVEWFDPVSPHVGGAAITEHFLDREAGNLPSENIQLNLLGEFQANSSNWARQAALPPLFVPPSLHAI